jgi:putative spermidine/putrescine transport system ATP-binding protein
VAGREVAGLGSLRIAEGRTVSGPLAAARRDAAAPAAAPHVVIERVQKTYDGRSLVVRDLDLTVGSGEFMTLLGPSGSGKTTTLMMLAGFEVPTSGRILLAGEPVERLPPHRRNIGMVFQNYALFPHMSVAENIAFPLRYRRLGAAERAERVQKALRMVHLESFAERRPTQLSGGQQQRVALARALVFEPRLVLMDEPLGALDKQLREQMQLEIRHLHEMLGVTVIYVTHDQSEALTMSDRIAVFHNGTIQQVADPATLYEEPANAFVAAFIGENNKLRGRVSAVEGEHCDVATADGTRIRARRIVPAAVGAETLVSVRPERLRIGGGPWENSFAGRVVECVYHGDHIRLTVAGLGQEDLVVKVANSGGRGAIAAGDVLQLGCQAEDCRALDP